MFRPGPHGRIPTLRRHPVDLPSSVRPICTGSTTALPLCRALGHLGDTTVLGESAEIAAAYRELL